MIAAPYASAASLAAAQDPFFRMVGAIEEGAGPLRAFFRGDRKHFMYFWHPNTCTKWLCGVVICAKKILDQG